MVYQYLHPEIYRNIIGEYSNDVNSLLLQKKYPFISIGEPSNDVK